MNRKHQWFFCIAYHIHKERSTTKIFIEIKTNTLKHQNRINVWAPFDLKCNTWIFFKRLFICIWNRWYVSRSFLIAGICFAMRIWITFTWLALMLLRRQKFCVCECLCVLGPKVVWTEKKHPGIFFDMFYHRNITSQKLFFVNIWFKMCQWLPDLRLKVPQSQIL